MFPASSVAFAVSERMPLFAAVVLQVASNGAVVSVAIDNPSLRNWTLATRRSSDAAAVIFTAPETLAPPIGEEMATVGATAWLPSA